MTAPTADLCAVVRPAVGHTSVSFEGRLTMDGAAVAREALQTLQQRSSKLVLDLSRVESIDAAGLGVLVAGLRRATSTGGSLTVSRASAAVLNAFHIVGLTNMVEAGDRA